TAVVALVLVPILSRPSAPLIQVATLDTAGTTRGSDTNETEVLRQMWEGATVGSFSTVEAFQSWETNWVGGTKRPIVKVAFDRAAGEVRLAGRWKGKSFERKFSVDQDLSTALKE